MRFLSPKILQKFVSAIGTSMVGEYWENYFLETGENVAEILIHGGWARPYHGEKKKAWTLEELTASPFV
jgi:hypothetical protein